VSEQQTKERRVCFKELDRYCRRCDKTYPRDYRFCPCCGRKCL
jgi:hypothetical protein